MSTFYTDDTITLLLGDAAGQAATLNPQSIQTVVTSPPYFGLRDYGVDGQLGAESSPAEFVANLVAVFDAIRPALADDGVLWVNLGDSYARRGGAGRGSGSTLQGRKHGNAQEASNLRRRKPGITIPEKNLLGIPWRFAFAMQDAGWILRNDIIWAKPNGMPESVRDRFSTKHEHVFLFAKSPRYYFDLDAVRRPLAQSSIARLAQYVDGQAGSARANAGGKTNGNMKAVPPGARQSKNGGGQSDKFAHGDGGANPGDWWEIASRPFSGAHFATFPPELPERCILASTRPGDSVLDPFSGSGTTGMVAGKHGRRYIGIDLNPEYHSLALKTRLAQGALFEGGAA